MSSHSSRAASNEGTSGFAVSAGALPVHDRRHFHGDIVREVGEGAGVAAIHDAHLTAVRGEGGDQRDGQRAEVGAPALLQERRFAAQLGVAVHLQEPLISFFRKSTNTSLSCGLSGTHTERVDLAVPRSTQ